MFGGPRLRKGPIVLNEEDLLCPDSPGSVTLTLLPEKLVNGFSVGLRFQEASNSVLPPKEEEKNYIHKRSQPRDSGSDGEDDAKVQGSGDVAKEKKR